MGIPLAAGFVIASLAKDLVGNEVLTGAVALDNGGHHVLGHVGIVGQELLGVLGQAVAAIAKRWVIVMGADAGVETNARDNGLGIEAFDFGIGVELVEVAYAQSKVCIGEKLNRFRFGHSHEETRDAFFG